MKQPFATSNKLGLPLDKPSTQSMLPVICGHNSAIRGFIPIAVTEFTEAETTMTIDGVEVAITSVTLPKVVDDGHQQRVRQYMAIVYPTEVQLQRPWIGFSEFVANDDAQYLGAKHTMAVLGSITEYYLGPFVTNLLVGMDNRTFAQEPNVPPTAANSTIRWVASLKTNPTGLDCRFFDFNWVDQFKAASDDVDPLNIELVQNPAGGFFKSTFAPFPVVRPLGSLQFNTIRILRLQPAPPGDYVFTYNITDSKGESVPATLTLTVV